MIARVALAVAALSLAASSQAQNRPDFSGRWKLDSTVTLGGGRGDASGNASGGGGGAGGGTGMGPPSELLNIRVSDTLVIVEERHGGDSTAIAYRLDGKKTPNEMFIGRGRKTQATYESHWNDGRIVSTISRTVSGPARNARIQYREWRYLSGESMIVQVSMIGRPAGRNAFYSRVQ